MISIIAHFTSSIIANAVILYIVSEYIPQLGFAIIDSGSTNVYGVFALLGTIFWVFNGIIKKTIKILTMPFAIVTLGLSSIVINIAIIYVFGYIVNTSSLGIQVQIGDLGQTAILSFTISVIYFILKKIF